MKAILFLLLLISLPAFSQTENPWPIKWPVDFPESEVNREYAKDGKSVISFKTRLAYEQACLALEKQLGEDWVKKVPNEEDAAEKQRLLDEPTLPFVGLDAYDSEKNPEFYITIAQVHNSVADAKFPYFLTIAIGPSPSPSE